MKVESKPTPLGKLYLEAQAKKHDDIDLRELQTEFNKDYMDNLTEAAMRGKKRHPGFDKYYVCVLMKRERLMNKVLRNYFITRVTCPSPSHDMTVYSFDAKTDDLKFLWLIPDKEVCAKVYANRYTNPNEITKYVVDFMEGRTREAAMKLNIDASNKQKL